MNNNYFLHRNLLEQAVIRLRDRYPLLVYGAFGSGKAFFVDKFVAEYSAANPRVVWARVDFENFSEDSFDSLDAVWKNLIFSVAENVGEDLNRFAEDWEKRTVKLPLQKAAEEFLSDTVNRFGKLVLVLENSHKVIRRENLRNFFDNLRAIAGEIAADSLQLVISMISDVEEVTVLGDGSPLFNASFKVPLTSLDDAQITALLASHSFDDSAATVGRIRNLVGGNLYFINVLLNYLDEARRDVRDALDDLNIRRIFSSDLETIRSMVAKVNGADKVLRRFAERDKISIDFYNLDKIVYNDLAKTGVLVREGVGNDIVYTIQGSVFKSLIGDSDVFLS